MSKKDYHKIIKLALEEDLGRKDLTAELITKTTLAKAYIICQQPAIIYAPLRRGVSGDVNLKNISSIAKARVYYISAGVITKTIIPIELSMLFLNPLDKKSNDFQN